MDETSFPVLLYDMLVRAGAISSIEARRFDAMIEASSGFIVRNGPATPQDRWEEDGGYSPFTLAVEIAALLAAADAMDVAGKTSIAGYLREVADGWNERIESWTYVADTQLSGKLGIAGYYIRIGVPDSNGVSGARAPVPIRNRTEQNASLEAELLVSPDALALVRFGLRAADDPRILNTVAAIDAVLKRDLPGGPYWYRYNGDGYGEHEDGAPFDGAGIGRLWPLLTGERAHYELAKGQTGEARRLLGALEASASPGGLLPEQIWDSDNIPALELFLGRPSGSAMPLAWAHAEHIKLLRSLRDGGVFDMPQQTKSRYIDGIPPPAPMSWRVTSKISNIVVGRTLRLELMEPARVRWTTDNWVTSVDGNTEPTGLETFIYDFSTRSLTPGGTIHFTFYWTAKDQWEGTNFSVAILSPAV
jgi:glucoamylase